MASNREQREARDRLRTYQARHKVHEEQGRRRRRDNLVAVLGGLAVIALAVTTQVLYFTAGPGVPEPSPSASSTPSATPDAESNVGAPDATLAEGRTWTGQLSLNDVVLDIELDGAAAPQAVSGWIADYQDGYYLDKTCHRLATSDGFSFIQCGSLDGTGAGDPDFSYGPIENAPADGVYPVGAIAMARASGDAYSNGHQFFIITEETTLPGDDAGGYTVVGTVTGGLDELIAQITSAGIDPDAIGTDGTGTPAIPTVITGLTLQ